MRYGTDNVAAPAVCALNVEGNVRCENAGDGTRRRKTMSRLHYWLVIVGLGSAAHALAGPLSVVPENVTISGPSNVSCSSSATARYYVYGGTPPYSVALT